MSEEDQGFEREPVRIRREKTADRPHRWTVWLSMGGPIVALAALYFSYQGYQTAQESLRVSQRSLSVGQRAYLAIKSGKTEITQFTELKDPDRPGRAVGYLDYGIVVENLGNTPASQIKYSMSMFLPKGWSSLSIAGKEDEKGGIRHNIISLGDTPQSSIATSRSDRVMLILDDEAWSEYQRREAVKGTPNEVFSRLVIRLRGVLEFRDVFGEPHKIKWCWFAEQGFELPLMCEQETLLDMIEPGR